jgi:hypothetical protein
MADDKSLAGGSSDHATTNHSHHAQQTPNHRRWIGVLMHRWPTALGIAVAALTAYDLDLDDSNLTFDSTLGFLSALLVLMALVYVGAAALARRRSAWVVLLVAFAVMVVAPLLAPGIDPSAVLLIAALVFVVLGAARGLLRRPGGLTLQTAGMFIFGAVGLGALYVDLELGSYLVAAGIIGHAL